MLSEVVSFTTLDSQFSDAIGPLVHRDCSFGDSRRDLRSAISQLVREACAVRVGVASPGCPSASWPILARNDAIICNPAIRESPQTPFACVALSRTMIHPVQAICGGALPPAAPLHSRDCLDGMCWHDVADGGSAA